MSSASSAPFPTLYSLFPGLPFSQCWYGSHHPHNEQVPVTNAKHVVALGLPPHTQPCYRTVPGVGHLAKLCATHTSNSPLLSYCRTQLEEVAVMLQAELLKALHSERSVGTKPDSNGQIQSVQHLMCFKRHPIHPSSLELNNQW